MCGTKRDRVSTFRIFQTKISAANRIPAAAGAGAVDTERDMRKDGHCRPGLSLERKG